MTTIVHGTSVIVTTVRRHDVLNMNTRTIAACVMDRIMMFMFKHTLSVTVVVSAANRLVMSPLFDIS